MHAQCHLCKMLVTKIIWNTCKYIICCLGMGSRSEQKDKRLVPHMYTSYTYSLQVILFIYLCMSILPACMYVYHVCARCLRRSEVGIRTPGTGVMGSCELPCGSSGRAASAHNHQPLFLPPGVISYNIFGASTFWLVLCTCIDFCSCGIMSVPKRVLDFFLHFQSIYPQLII